MLMYWRGNRKIPVQKDTAKQLKKMLKCSNNSTELKRINIMIVYLGWENSSRTSEILWVSKWTVQNVITKYVNDPKWFYKTNYKGKIETEERKELKKKTKDLVETMLSKEENPDINKILREINRIYSKKNKGEPIINYHWMRRILRKYFKYNYQKPFVKNNKQPENAEEIVKERLTEAIIEIQVEENFDVDTVAIKNKKTKFWEVRV